MIFARSESTADRFGLSLVVAEYDHVASAWGFFERLPEPMWPSDTPPPTRDDSPRSDPDT